VLGTDELFEYIEKYQVTLDSHYDGLLKTTPKKEWKQFINQQNASLANDEALNLLNKMMVYDHAQRVTPKDAMEDPYFKPVRDFYKQNQQ
jgi:casein kinase II subunit alpha